MKNEFSIKIAGEAGLGIQTIGGVLCKIFKKAGLYIFANQDYMSRVRGGYNYYQIRVADNPLYALREKIDISVALDALSVTMHREDLAENSIMILDKKKFKISEENKIFFDVPIYEMAMQTGGNDIFINSVSCGVILGIIKMGFNYLEDLLRETFADKGEDIIKKNIDSAKTGYDFAIKNFEHDVFRLKEGNAGGKILINGNDAIALGAISGGCKFYSAYPMTPSTSIMNVIAEYAQKYNIIVEQAEDEIAAINMIIGASYAGVRSMTATSGGGFCLMVEGLSLSGMTETPIVVVNAQRPAPATGFPTRTEQADLEFLLHAGHGEFARVIYSPGTIEEAFYLTVKAFNIAEKYQIPVLIMTDQHLADSYRNIDMFDLEKIKVKRHIITKEESRTVSNYKRYQLTESGISPRAIPGWIENVVYADSDEHTEEGHITEDAEMRKSMVEKRFYKKMNGLLKETEKPVAFNIDNSDTILIGFGSTYGVLKEVAEIKKIGFVHLPQVWPFPGEEITSLLKKTKKIMTVENNAGAQLARLIRRETGIKVDKSILKYDGRPFNVDYVLNRI